MRSNPFPRGFDYTAVQYSRPKTFLRDDGYSRNPTMLLCIFLLSTVPDSQPVHWSAYRKLLMDDIVPSVKPNIIIERFVVVFVAFEIFLRYHHHTRYHRCSAVHCRSERRKEAEQAYISRKKVYKKERRWLVMACMVSCMIAASPPILAINIV